jgi:outer membrane protein insertion porin family
LVFTNGIEGGYIGWFGSDQRNQFNRFYLGGTPLQQQQTFYRENIDLKGFPGGFGGSISPLVNGEAVGGTIYNKYFTEMRYPVVANEQIQLIPYVFAEAGNAYLDFSTYDPFNVKRSAGFGLRVFLPILGLVDLSYGRRFDGIPGTTVESGKWEFLFNIGAPF